MSEPTVWLLSTLFWTMLMSFYSMQEMALISCNKLRLDFAVAQKKRWALLVQNLLERPSVLFSTTLIGVNVALMMSSESSRRFFSACGLDPNLAPFAEIPFVLIFGELIPMFAARLYADHASRLGVGLLYLTAKLLTPLIFAGKYIAKIVGRLLGKKSKKEHAAFLSRDELQRLLEEHHGGYLGEQEMPVNDMIGNIFTLRNKRAAQLMQKLEPIFCVSTHTTVGELRAKAAHNNQSLFLVFHRTLQKIVGYVYPQNLLTAKDNKRVEEYAEQPFFVAKETPLLSLLHKMQERALDAAIVINSKGVAEGVVFIEDLIDELFGSQAPASIQSSYYLEKTIDADTHIEDFNEAYDTQIDPQGCKTFAELIEKILERHPHAGDEIAYGPFEIVVKETSLFKAKSLLIRTKAI